MDYRMNAVWYRIRRENNNSQSFMDDVMDAIVDGFLVEGDVLVLDNAAIHTGGENDMLCSLLRRRDRFNELEESLLRPAWRRPI